MKLVLEEVFNENSENEEENEEEMTYPEHNSERPQQTIRKPRHLEDCV